jgi:hypothetical protein
MIASQPQPDWSNPRQLLVAIARCHPEADDDELLALFQAELRDRDLTQATDRIISEWFRQVRSTARTASRCLLVHPVARVQVRPLVRPVATILPFVKAKAE